MSDVDELVKLGFSEQKQVGVYALVLDSEVVYIGKSTNLRRRLGEHRRIKYDRIFVFNCHEDYLDTLEFRLINQFKPCRNKVGKQEKTPKGIDVLNVLGIKPKFIRRC